MERKVCIVNIGFELLQGRVINTNASTLARKLSLLGHNVRTIIVVGDDYVDIERALMLCIELFGCDTIITTGGLGPTPDDITMEAIARTFRIPLEINEIALQEIEKKYKAIGKELTEDRIKMAKIPRGAEIIPNPVGIAPGCWLKILWKDRPIEIIVLPGVPKEMEAMFKNYVEPRLSIGRIVVEAEIIVPGGRESDIAPILKEYARRYSNIYIKSHPEGHEIQSPRLRIYFAFYGINRDQLENQCHEVLESFVNDLRKLSLESYVVKLCTT